MRTSKDSRVRVAELVAARAPITSFSALAALLDTTNSPRALSDRITYTREGRESLRHLMETGEPGETILHTLRLCVLHEGAKDAGDFEAEILSESPIHMELALDDNNEDGLHLRTAWPLRVVRGELRRIPLQDGDALLGPVDMVELGALIDETERRTSTFHWQASYAALEFAARDGRVHRNYGRYLDRGRRSISTLSPSAMDMALDYVEANLGSW